MSNKQNNNNKPVKPSSSQSSSPPDYKKMYEEKKAENNILTKDNKDLIHDRYVLENKVERLTNKIVSMSADYKTVSKQSNQKDKHINCQTEYINMLRKNQKDDNDDSDDNDNAGNNKGPRTFTQIYMF